MDYKDTHRTYTTTENRRWRVSGNGLSWRAIFAGTLTVIAVSVLLNLLGLAAGLGSIDPATEQNPFSGIGTGALIWWVLSNLIALFCGGWVAGRAGRTASNNGGLIQGFLTWALYSIISIWLVTSAIGSILSGVGNVIGSTLSTAGNAVEQLASDSGNNQQNNSNQQAAISLDQVKREVYSLLEDTGKQKLDPDQIEENVQEVKTETKQEVNDGEMQSARAEIEEIFRNARNEFDGTFKALDQEALANVLSERTNMSKEEANRRIEQAQGQYQNIIQKAETQLQDLKENSAEAAEKASDSVASAAMWLAIALILGAITGALGGLAGAKKLRHDYRDSFEDTRRDEVVH